MSKCDQTGRSSQWALMVVLALATCGSTIAPPARRHRLSWRPLRLRWRPVIGRRADAGPARALVGAETVSKALSSKA